jgi:hypothetical protein
LLQFRFRIPMDGGQQFPDLDRVDKETLQAISRQETQPRKFRLVSRNLGICAFVGINKSPPVRLVPQPLLDAFGSAVLTISPFLIREAHE